MPNQPTAAAQRSFWCFISYRHSDNKDSGRQWASWLHQSIETYEVPADLVGTVNERGDTIPERIYPVFRDEDELPVNADLATPIYHALDVSKFLLVICSPRSVQSPYVAQEICYFKQLGREDRVLAAMIDGEPNANTKSRKGKEFEECFPEPLRHRVDRNGTVMPELAEPVAADFRLDDGSQGWCSPEAYRQDLKQSERYSNNIIDQKVAAYQQRCDLMKLKIMAGVLGVPLGTLTQRDKAYQLALSRKRARRLRQWLAAVAVLGILAIVGAIVAQQQATIAREKSKLAQQQTILAQQQTVEAEQQRTRAEQQTQIATENLSLAKSRLAETYYQNAARATQGPAGRDPEAMTNLVRSLEAAPDYIAAQRLTSQMMATRSWVVPIIQVTAADEILQAWISPHADQALIVTKEGIVQQFDLQAGQLLAEANLREKLPQGAVIHSVASNQAQNQIAMLCQVAKPRNFTTEWGDVALAWSWQLFVFSSKGMLIGSDTMESTNKDKDFYASHTARADRLADQPLFYSDDSLLLMVTDHEIHGWKSPLTQGQLQHLGTHTIPLSERESISGWEYELPKHQLKILTNRQVFYQNVGNGVVTARQVFVEEPDEMFPHVDAFSGMVSFGSNLQAAVSGVVDASFQLPEGVGVNLSQQLGKANAEYSSVARTYSGVCQFTADHGWIHHDGNSLRYSYVYAVDESNKKDFSVSFSAMNRATEWPPLLIRDSRDALLLLSTVQSATSAPQLLERIDKPKSSSTLRDAEHHGLSQILDGTTCWVSPLVTQLAQIHHKQLTLYRIGWQAPLDKDASSPTVKRPLSFNEQDEKTIDPIKAPELLWDAKKQQCSLTANGMDFHADARIKPEQWVTSYALEKAQVQLLLFNEHSYSLESSGDEEYGKKYIVWILHLDTGESFVSEAITSFSVDGTERLLATSDGIDVTVRSLAEKKELRTFRPKRWSNHMTSPAYSVFFSIDSAVLGVGSLSSVQDYAFDYRAFDVDTGCEFMLARHGHSLWHFDLFPEPRDYEIQEWQDGKVPTVRKPFFINGYGADFAAALTRSPSRTSMQQSSVAAGGTSSFSWSTIRWPEFYAK